MLDRKSTLLLNCAAVICGVVLYEAGADLLVAEGKLFFADAYNDGWSSLFYTANLLFPSVSAAVVVQIFVCLWCCCSGAAWSLVFGWFAVQIPFIAETRNMPDQNWKKYAERIATGQAMTIPITPLGWGLSLKEKPGRAP